MINVKDGQSNQKTEKSVIFETTKFVFQNRTVENWVFVYRKVYGDVSGV